MRVLVTGSSGFIGTALVAALRARGDVVVPARRMGRGGSAPPAPGEVGIDLEHGRLDLSGLGEEGLEGIGASVHLAGAPLIGRWTAARKAAIRSSRVDLGALIAESVAALEHRPSVHVTGSAVGFYGERGEEVLDESAAVGTGYLAELCRAWEGATAPAARSGIRTVALRSGIVLGDGGLLRVELPLFKLGLGARLGSGRQWTSWISLSDEVGAILAALDNPELYGPINATSPEPVRNAELTAAIARAVKRPAVLALPAALLRRLAGAEPADEMLLVSQRARPRRLEEAGFCFANPSLKSALDAAVHGSRR